VASGAVLREQLLPDDGAPLGPGEPADAGDDVCGGALEGSAGSPSPQATAKQATRASARLCESVMEKTLRTPRDTRE
jgi:hypothetical protein